MPRNYMTGPTNIWEDDRVWVVVEMMNVGETVIGVCRDEESARIYIERHRKPGENLRAFEYEVQSILETADEWRSMMRNLKKAGE